LPVDLRTLLSEPSFALRPRAAVDDAALDLPLAWAHSTDLPDPTRWLDAGGILLTDGAQFLPPHNVAADVYVRRLVEHGVSAVGFAVGILHDEIPPELITACETQRLPLVEVSTRTPFMGMIRFVSDANAADDRALLERSLLAQRRVARAALRPDGLNEILRELERGLDCWVAFFDAAGTPVPLPATRGIPPELVAQVESAATEALARGTTAAVRLAERGAGSITLQTLGRRESLRGVLAVGIAGDTFDAASKDLFDSVIALASISLEQSRTLDSARRRLRSGILELLSAGVTDVAGRTVQHLWGELPADPVRVGRITLPSQGDFAAHPALAALELMAEAQAGSIFFAEHDDDVVVIVRDDGHDAVRALARRHRLAIGFSTATSWLYLNEALAEARRAVARTSDRQPCVYFDDLAQAGILGHLEQTRAHEVARAVLLPLGDDPGLRHVLEVWLRHNCSWGPAADELGMHRHTLRHRVDGAAERLGLDLDAFGARAELWHALKLTDPA
jgi:purine catabolism regulator